MQQATANLLADMSALPATLQPGLTSPTESSDAGPPSSTITSPSTGATLAVGQAVTVAGTASDTAGMVGGVEVSTDGGTTWLPAQGRDTWTYNWTPSSAGSVTLKTRAVDDSGNLETPSAGTTVTVAGQTCPCSIWSNSTTPATVSDPDTAAVELGVKFRTDVDGFVTGLRFYKGSANTGTHVGHLWTSGGTLLAQATFSGESASGWQQVSLASPAAVAAGTTYVASYHAPNGRYAADGGYFAGSAVDNPPLTALRDGQDGPNSIYKYGASGSFPDQSFNATNYWVDVVFVTDVGPDNTAPTVLSVSPGDGAAGIGTSANVTVTFSEGIAESSLTGNFELRDGSGALVPAAVSYSSATHTATLDPNAAFPAPRVTPLR